MKFCAPKVCPYHTIASSLGTEDRRAQSLIKHLCKVQKHVDGVSRVFGGTQADRFQFLFVCLFVCLFVYLKAYPQSQVNSKHS